MRLNPLGVTVRILLLACSALAVFSITAVLCAIPLAWVQHNSLASAGIITVGVVCGLIAWLFVAVFHIRKESLTLLHDDRAALLTQLRRELEEIGYEVSKQHQGKTIFKPRFTALLVGGSVHVTELPDGLFATGPKVFIEMLRKRMKLHTHISTMQQNIHDSRVRQGRHLLRRVEIDLRVTPGQWQKIHDDVLSVLAAQEANIVCEVHILAQKETGILDTSVEVCIRERLRKQKIPVEIRKEAKSTPEFRLADLLAE